MQLTGAVAVCDAIEIAVLILKRDLSIDNLLTEFHAGSKKNELERQQITEALAVGILRSTACPKGYPFEVSTNMIRLKPSKPLYKPYLFLLMGYCLSHRGMAVNGPLSDKFRDVFEDFVCWVFRQHGFVAEVLSIPRSSRRLPTQLKPALLLIKDRLGESGTLQEHKLNAHDNDLDVDVIATPMRGDRGRGGWPVVLVQCATGTVANLKMKMQEIGKTFVSVWEPGFYEVCAIKGGATPDDLIPLTENDWGRISEDGWVLHRMRLVHMAVNSSSRKCQLPKVVLRVNEDLKAALPNYDWRNFGKTED